MKNNSCLILLIFINLFALNACLTAQHITKVNNKQYEYQGQLFKYEDLGNVFLQHNVSYDYFVIANKKIKASKRWRNACLGSLGTLFSGLAIIGGNHYLGDTSPVILFFTAASAIVFPISLIGGISTSVDGRKYRKKSLVSFNELSSVSFDQIGQVEQVLINVVVKNGIGIQIIF